MPAKKSTSSKEKEKEIDKSSDEEQDVLDDSAKSQTSTSIPIIISTSSSSNNSSSTNISSQPQVQQPIQQPPIFRNNKLPSTFNGTTNVLEWLSDLESCILINGWTEREFIKLLPAFVSGSAKTLFNINKNQLSNFKDVQAIFKKEFSLTNFRSLKKNIMNRKQKIDEKFSPYALSIYDLCLQLKSDMDDIEINNYVLDNCLVYLKEKLLPHLDLTFNEFLEKGRNLEELNNNENLLIEKRNYNRNNGRNFQNHGRNFQDYPRNFQDYSRNSFNSRDNGRNNSFNNSNSRNNTFDSINNDFNHRNYFSSRNTSFSPKNSSQTRSNFRRNNQSNQSKFRRTNQYNNQKKNWKKKNEQNNVITGIENDSILKTKAKVYDKTTEIIFDTGSTVSIMDVRLANQANCKIFPEKIQQITTAAGTFHTIGYSKIVVQIEDAKFFHDVLVSKFKYPLLLGMDFLQKHKFVINFRNNTISNNSKIDLNLTSISEPKINSIDSFMKKYADVFNDKPSIAKVEPFKIRLLDNKPLNITYRLAKSEDEIVQKEIENMLNQGIIRKSKSPYSFPLVVVKKKDNSNRICVDFRALNKVTIKDSFPLPRVDDILNNIGNAKYFSKLDFSSGYYQIPLASEDKMKTAFRTSKGLFEFNVLPFGLVNAPSHFQRVVNSILEKFIGKFVHVYLDDILIYSNTLEEHLTHLQKIFDILVEKNIKLKLKKCGIAKTQIDYLGYKVSFEKIQPQRDKCKSISEAKIPQNVNQLQTFLGMINYYRKFIANFSKKASPLYELLKKDVKFEFGPRQVIAFELLKKELTSKPIFLSVPNFSQPFTLQTDASNDGIGAILSQGHKVIEYASRKLNTAERNYSTIEKELLAIVWSLQYFRYYLLGRSFVIETDHNPLTFIDKIKSNSRIVRWKLKMAEYDYQIKYKPGRFNNADFLSRTSHEVNILDTLSLETIIKEQKSDPEVQSIKQQSNYGVIDGVIYNLKKGKRLLVPKSLRNEILELNHNHKLSGHLGFRKTYNKIKTNYIWPGLKNSVEIWVNNCKECQKKNYSKEKIGLLNPLPVVSDLFERLGMDILGPLEKSQSGNQYILVITEYLSRYATAIPLKSIESKVIAKEFVDKVVLTHGCPKNILTDRGTNFISEFMQEFYELLDIKKLTTTAYRPQTNSLTERFNRTLINMIIPFVNKDKNNWDDLLPYLMFAYNTSINETTKCTPFEIMFCRKPNLPNSMNFNTSDSFHQRVLDGLKLRERIKDEIDVSQEKQKFQFNKSRKHITFKIGDYVMLNNPVAKKLEFKWTGPYKIIDKVSDLNYKISLPNSSRTHDIVHIARLKKINKRIDTQVFIPPEEDEEPEFEIEKIIDKKRMKSNDGKMRIYYLVKWKDYDDSFNTWEPSSNLVNAKQAIQEFEKLIKQKKKF